MGTRDRTSAAGLNRRVRGIIRSGEMSGGDHEFLLELLAWHPTPGKVAGLRSVRINDGRNGLVIELADGATDHIDFRKCSAAKTGGSPPDHRSRCLEAMRHAVMPQTLGFRHRSGHGGLGGITHVGHDWTRGDTFVELAERFVMERRGGDWGSVAVRKGSPSPEGYLPYVLCDPLVDAAWTAFHLDHAVLRMERAEDNLRDSRRTSRCAGGSRVSPASRESDNGAAQCLPPTHASRHRKAAGPRFIPSPRDTGFFNISQFF